MPQHDSHEANRLSWNAATDAHNSHKQDQADGGSTLREYPYSNGFKRFSDMREVAGKRFVMPEGLPTIPMMLGVVAQKPTG